MTNPKTISPAAAAALVENGALLVDIRELAERQAGVIPGAAHAPLSALPNCDIPAAPGQPAGPAEAREFRSRERRPRQVRGAAPRATAGKTAFRRGPHGGGSGWGDSKAGKGSVGSRGDPRRLGRERHLRRWGRLQAVFQT